MNALTALIINRVFIDMGMLEEQNYRVCYEIVFPCVSFSLPHILIPKIMEDMVIRDSNIQNFYRSVSYISLPFSL